MPQRIKMVERDPNVRNKDFEEVNGAVREKSCQIW